MEHAMSLHSDGHNVVGFQTNHTSQTARERIAAAFRRAMAISKSPAKELARRLNRTPNGAAMLLRGEVSPQLETIIAACREFDDVWVEFRELCGRANTESEAEQLLAQIAQSLRERRQS